MLTRLPLPWKLFFLLEIGGGLSSFSSINAVCSRMTFAASRAFCVVLGLNCRAGEARSVGFLGAAAIVDGWFSATTPGVRGYWRPPSGVAESSIAKRTRFASGEGVLGPARRRELWRVSAGGDWVIVALPMLMADRRADVMPSLMALVRRLALSGWGILRLGLRREAAIVLDAGVSEIVGETYEDRSDGSEVRQTV